MVNATDGLAAHDLDQLRRACGEVITADDATYDEARRLWNAIHDRRPAAIVRPLTAENVATAVRFARDHDLVIAVQSGGHSAAGLRGPDGGLVIDLSAMRGVEVDPRTRTARANGGAFLGELDVAAQAHGLVCPVGVVGHTGVAGLTLGGGVGRLQRHFGLTIDNLAAVELVTADGRLVRASETEEPDLFWGLRGAGWNFGIATAFEFRLQPFGPDLHRGVLTFAATQVRELWGIFREYALERTGCGVGDLRVRSSGARRRLRRRHGRQADRLLRLEPQRRAEDVERDTAGASARPDAADHDDRQLAVSRGPDRPRPRVPVGQPLVHQEPQRGRRPTGGARRAGRAHRDGAGEGTFSVTALGGAIARVAEDATAYAGRAAAFDLSADANWSDPAEDETVIDWCRRAMAVVEPDRTLGAYPNGNSDAGPEETRRLYGDAKLARLSALKRTWDPDNVFHVNPNVAPASG